MDLLGEIIFISLVTCALSSGWLYSELLGEFREWWLRYYKDRKIVYLAICQLCCSFWFALPITFLTCQSIAWYGMILVSLAAAVTSWGIGSFVMMTLWIKAYYEKMYTLIDKEHVRGKE